MIVEAVVAAWNEAPRVAAVVRPLRATAALSRVLVVDDGSTDGTGDAARGAGADVLTLPRNGGKGAALLAGVASALTRGVDAIAMFDADLLGLEPRHVEAMLSPVLAHQAVMICGVQDHGVLGNVVQLQLPPITGQRVVVRDVWSRLVPGLSQGYRVEMGLNHAATCTGPWWSITLRGVTAAPKGAKVGAVEGALRDARMAREVLLAWRDSAVTACVVPDGGRS